MSQRKPSMVSVKTIKGGVRMHLYPDTISMYEAIKLYEWLGRVIQYKTDKDGVKG